MSDFVEVLPAMFNERTAAAITGFVSLSMVMAFDATPPALLAPLQVMGCPLAEQMNDDLIDQIHDVLVTANRGVEVERPKALRPPGC